jgi:hypothetical protein
MVGLLAFPVILNLLYIGEFGSKVGAKPGYLWRTISKISWTSMDEMAASHIDLVESLQVDICLLQKINFHVGWKQREEILVIQEISSTPAL